MTPPFGNPYEEYLHHAGLVEAELDRVWVHHLQKRMQESNVPFHLWSGLVAYITERKRPGDFLVSVLENNLAEAVKRADAVNVHRLRDIVDFLIGFAPGQCWKSPAAVEAWLADPKPPTPLFD